MRVVELIDTGSSNNWDAHGNMQDHRPKALRVDRRDRGPDPGPQGDAACSTRRWSPSAPSSAARRGPTAPERRAATITPRPSRSLLAGAGVKGGMTYGETDEYGINIVADPVHVHDYHATILHLMGIDHTRLTYRYAGRDFRLTDVAGNVISRDLELILVGPDDLAAGSRG